MMRMLKPMTRSSGMSWEEALDESVRAVYVCSPDALHDEHSIRALRRGKHVLTEKPVSNFEARILAHPRPASSPHDKSVFRHVHTRSSLRRRCAEGLFTQVPAHQAIRHAARGQARDGKYLDRRVLMVRPFVQSSLVVSSRVVAFFSALFAAIILTRCLQ